MKIWLKNNDKQIKGTGQKKKKRRNPSGQHDIRFSSINKWDATILIMVR